MAVNRLPKLLALAACLASTLSAPAQAATLSYVLDESNAAAGLPSDSGYLRVSLADRGDGAIEVTVTILEPLLDLAGPNFGLHSFGFNSDTQVLGSANISGLPSGWSVTTNRNQNGFGRFDLVVRARGGSRVSPTLSFAIVGPGDHSVFDYVAWSDGHADEENRWFAAHVAGFETEPGPLGEPLTSAFFAPSRAVIPAPPAAWLFAAAIGVLGLARRGRSLSACSLSR